MKTIRLRKPIRAGKDIHPNNAVFDAADDVADELIAAGCAEETDAIERYPIGNPLNHVDDFPVSGAEKFPLAEPRKGDDIGGTFVNHADRLVAERIQEGAPPFAPASKEPAPAKVEVTKEMKEAGEPPTAVEAAARAAAPIPVVVVDDDKAKAKKG
jgi:hypothetical protein